MSRGHLVLAALAVGWFVGTASAAPIVVEDFVYPAGPLAGQNGGEGWAGPWTPASKDVVAPGLSYPGLQSFGNAYDGRTGAQRNFKGTYNSGQVWFSMLSRPDQQGVNNFPNSGFDFFQGGSKKFWVGSGWNVPGPDDHRGLWGLSVPPFAAPDHSYTAPITVGQTDFLVVLIDFGAAGTGDEDLYLWVNPDLDATPALASADSTMLNQSISGFDRIRYFGGSSAYTVDRIKIGNTYQDLVVPEPGSIALLGLGMGLLWLRRRRSA